MCSMEQNLLCPQIFEPGGYIVCMYVYIDASIRMFLMAFVFIYLCITICIYVGQSWALATILTILIFLYNEKNIYILCML